MWLMFLSMFFTPGVELYGSELDGAWVFGEVVGEERELSGGQEFLVNGEVVELNSADSPDYLVSNRYEWEFVGDGRELWLSFSYQLWSEESELGFDEPVLVVFLDDLLIFKIGLERCCELEGEEIYLGELSGKHRLSFFAGEMGDLEKPSGVVIEELKLLSKESGLLREISDEPETVIVGADLEKITVVLDDSPETVITGTGIGEVLGARDEGGDEGVDWRVKLWELMNKPHVLLSVWVVISILVRAIFIGKTVKVTDNVSFELKNLISSKNIFQKGTT